MKKIIFSFLAGAALLASCSQNNGYVIYGTVSNPDLEGAQVFLVPLENATKETVDSVYIHDQMFEFRGTEERVAEIRINGIRSGAQFSPFFLLINGQGRIKIVFFVGQGNGVGGALHQKIINIQGNG